MGSGPISSSPWPGGWPTPPSWYAFNVGYEGETIKPNRQVGYETRSTWPIMRSGRG